METVTRFENIIGKRVGTGYPRFTRWEFSARISNIESRFTLSVCT
jgi:hypothetical protein